MKRIICLILFLLLIPNVSFAIDKTVVVDRDKTIYELDLMKGIIDTSFNATDNITIGETIALACRLHSLYYHNDNSFSAGSPWYQAYVNYALKNGIIRHTYQNYSKFATRAEFATILSKALPSKALETINVIDDGTIPDISTEAYYADAVYKLYRAGILTGNGSSGSFTPNSNISRNSVATIVTRMADKRLRKEVMLLKKSISLNLDYAFISDNEEVKLMLHDVKGKAIIKGVRWTSSDPDFVSVKDGIVSFLHEGFGRAIITATTNAGTTAQCMVIEKSKDIVSNNNGENTVYNLFPSILSIENVYPDIVMWYDSSLDYAPFDYHYYTYQTKTRSEAESYAKAYAEYLVSNGYKLTSSGKEPDDTPGIGYEIRYELENFSGQFTINIVATIAAVGDRYQHPIVDVTIDDNYISQDVDND
ncbi:MAG: S-layer homology domain-containing protein [Aminipila sp.]